MSFTMPLSKGITRHHDTYPFIHPSKYAGKLAGKVVLVTGASRGIGRATALSFAAAGAHVAALARTSPEITTLVSEIKTKYAVPAMALAGSVLDDPNKIIADVEKELGPIDILVNNAGITRIGPITEEKNLDLWWNVMEVNVKAPVALIHAILPSFVARKGGIIITVGSAASELQIPYLSSYITSKAALLRTINTIDLELRPMGILNYYIHPGGVNTSLASGDEKVNGPKMKEFMDGFKDILADTPELAADTMVALVGEGEKCGVLSGRYFDAQEDLGEILSEKEKIEREDLYALRITRL